MKTLIALLGLLVAIRLPAETLDIGPRHFKSINTNTSPTGSLVEYVPTNETLQSWTKLFAVRQMRNEKNPKEYIEKLGAEYTKKFPHMRFAQGGQKDRNRWFIDFVVYPAKGEPKFVEWNFFRAETNTGGGLVVFQYAERKPFTESGAEVLREWNLRELRSQMLPLLMTNEFATQNLRSK